ncbi:embryo-specific protein ATS3A-like [Lycium barbarum]|uniref:embryo-specific protein ATS3A-like n=1 Tax=Lycium ferocissimum TaxID=112874 RepID=UPI002815A779|nr:embryo-specific protein ATS3A-like [Lycium ferocissimum]XP_060167683.1 embryo-specific protein ATS3A-like [Lycium barbarum]
MKMCGRLLVLLFLSLSFFFFNFSQARSIITSTSTKQDVTAARKCSYTLTIKTSCSSSKYTRDKVSIAFGDSYGFEVYAPRLDNPSSRIFERCSTDTFKINGPCTYEICYLYLKRVGSDGWKPQSVKVYGPSRPVITFKFNKFLPNGVWFGFNHCLKLSASVM